VPRVGVVIVNHDGAEVTRRCLDMLEASDWPSEALDVVVVDNGSHDGLAVQLEAGLRRARVIRLARNEGFAAAVNVGLRELDGLPYVALLNNDAFVSPDWLRPLVDALERDSTAGAACPKILLAGRFAALDIDVRPHVRGRGDHRLLGVRVEGVRVNGRERRDDVRYAAGFHGPERRGARGYQWTADHARLYVPLDSAASSALVEVLMSSDFPKTVTLSSAASRATASVSEVSGWAGVAASALGADLVNSAGSLVLESGYGADRGYLEPDDGRLDRPTEVFGWSGCAALLRREYLDDIGTFDERLFLYYEDFDLAWRGRARGWRCLYVPTSVVHHSHGVTARRTPWLAEYCKERNRLVVHTKNAPRRVLYGAYSDALRALGLHVVRDVISRALHGERPHVGYVTLRSAALTGFAARLPGALLARRDLRDRQTIEDEALIAWVRPRAGGRGSPPVVTRVDDI
jgi:GT2 family glycosyltransferase